MDSLHGTVTVTGRGGVPLTVTAPAKAARQSPAERGEVPPRGAVIVIQEAFGVTDAIVDITRTLASHGYLAIAPHLYHRLEKQSMTSFAAARPAMKTLTADDLTYDLTDAFEFAQAAGVDPIHTGMVGFCLGGTVALWAAAKWRLAAAVTFYGSGILTSRWPGVPSGIESAKALQTPWLGLYGRNDTAIKQSEIDQLADVVIAQDVPTDIVRYPKAGHAFATDPSSPKYSEEAARDAWARALAWFDAHV